MAGIVVGRRKMKLPPPNDVGRNITAERLAVTETVMASPLSRLVHLPPERAVHDGEIGTLDVGKPPLPIPGRPVEKVTAWLWTVESMVSMRTASQRAVVWATYIALNACAATSEIWSVASTVMIEIMAVIAASA